METDIEGEMSKEPIIGINRIFVGYDGQEVCPRNVEDLATKGTTDDKYRDLIKFVEGEQNWREASDDIKSYQQLINDIGVETFGMAKLLIYTGCKVIPPHNSRRDLLIIRSTHKSGDDFENYQK